MIYILIAGGIFFLDYNLKNYTDRNRLQGTNDEYFHGKIILRNCHNSYGGFELFKKNPKLGTQVSFVVYICAAWEFLKLLFSKGHALSKLGMSLVIGGGASNVFDRWKKGYVSDYVSLGVKNKKIRNIVFNVSDLFIMGGGLLYLIGQVVSLTRKKA